MIRNRILTFVCCFVPAVAAAQAPQPAQTPQAPQAPQPPHVLVTPAPPPQPFVNLDLNIPELAGEAAQLAAQAAQLRMEKLYQNGAISLNSKLATIQPFALFQRRGANDDGFWEYQRGQDAMDRSQWSQALTDFTNVANRGGSRADGALYWKAYNLNKLGRRDEALAAIADLRKMYASSRWLDDANALEIEIKQASGQNVSPENQPDEDLKLMALNAVVNTDPDRALPVLENLLKSTQSLRLKERALFVLAQSTSPRAQQLIEQVAKGSGNGNPDLQLKAIQYLGLAGHKQGASGGSYNVFLFDIYTAATDENVKRALLQAFLSAGDTDHLLQAVKGEKSPELKVEGIRYLAGKPEIGDALVALWGNEQDRQVKQAILDTLTGQRNAKALVEVARQERDPEMKKQIVQRLSTMKSKDATDYLLELLK